jgi:hypothetical protein
MNYIPDDWRVWPGVPAHFTHTSGLPRQITCTFLPDSFKPAYWSEAALQHVRNHLQDGIIIIYIHVKMRPDPPRYFVP